MLGGLIDYGRRTSWVLIFSVWAEIGANLGCLVSFILDFNNLLLMGSNC
jgi:hypothetical protein